ncbi:MAG: sensor histidine kinase, partial [Actinobacteria bacterium]|nr:sensor histidine kinase [Actinomycetota bacterium]
EDELARLGTAFNEMASTLASQITRLENLSKVQQRFVSDVSHELRTPLTTIRMAADVIHNARAEFDPNVARSAELLLSQIDRFEALLADLLEVSRFDANVASVTMKEVDVSEIVRKVSDELANLAAEKGSPIRLQLPTEAITIDGDQPRLERILRNLITNAIDHAEQLPIDISVASNGSDVSVSVRDYGVGLTEQQMSQVFDRFWRADPSRSRLRGGTGLGLAIAKDDAALHGGIIKVWGEIGKGSNFVLSIPRVHGAQLSSTPLSEIPN